MSKPPARWPLPFGAYRAMGELAAPLIGAAVARKYRASPLASRNYERFGFGAPDAPGAPLIWLHAASLGETRSAQSLLSLLRRERPDWRFLVTYWTESAAALAHTPEFGADYTAFFPIDTGPVRRRFITTWQPKAALFIESELWPGWIDALYRKQIPLALVNARISERSARRWQKLPRFTEAMLQRVPQILTQNDELAERFRRIGAPQHHVSVSGDLKSAASPLAVDESTLATWKTALQNRAVWVAASTHPGEEEQLLAAHRELLAHNPDALLILVPRHAERGAALASLAQTQGFETISRSEGVMPKLSTTIVIGNSFGELGLWYRLGEAVFLGGSLTNLGGHNPYEPARLRRAILSGPSIYNFQDAYDGLRDHEGALLIAGDALGGVLVERFEKGTFSEMGQAAEQFSARSQDIPHHVSRLLNSGVLKEL